MRYSDWERSSVERFTAFNVLLFYARLWGCKRQARWTGSWKALEKMPCDWFSLFQNFLDELS